MQEQRQFWRNKALGLNVMHATHVEYAYPRHSHEEYVVALIEGGVQSFTVKGTKYVTPPSGLILINPDEIHTGEAVTAHGFKIRSLYPSMAHMQRVGMRNNDVPYFRNVREDDREAAHMLHAFHQAIVDEASELEIESRFLAAMSLLIERYAEFRPKSPKIGNERSAIHKTRQYIEAHFAQGVTLNELAEQAALSPHYLLRAFCKEVGLPPHAYLQDVRVRHAQRLIEAGEPLSDVAFAVGFSSQSHLTRRFKQFVGVTPGRYARQIRPN